MIKPNQLINIMPYGSNIQYYQKLGYKFEKGESISVSPEQLPKGSKIKIKVICDKCGTEYEIENKFYWKSREKHNGKNYCIHCVHDITEVKNNKKKLLINQYGVENVFQLDDTKIKIRQTCQEKYNCTNPMQSNLIRQKTEETMIQRYGVKHPLQSPIFQEQFANTLSQHGNVKTSSQQYEIYKLLSQVYKDCELNYVEGKFFLDCRIVVDSVPVDIEYDGDYWHKNQQADIKRDKLLQKKGYKVLRIRSKRLLPSKDELIKSINQLINSDKNFLQINLADIQNETI